MAADMNPRRTAKFGRCQDPRARVLRKVRRSRVRARSFLSRFERLLSLRAYRAAHGSLKSLGPRYSLVRTNFVGYLRTIPEERSKFTRARNASLPGKLPTDGA